MRDPNDQPVWIKVGDFFSPHYEFWSRLEVGPFRNPLLDKNARDGIIREIAKLHSATVDGIDHFKHRTHPEEHLIWNTYHAYEHIGNYN